MISVEFASALRRSEDGVLERIEMRMSVGVSCCQCDGISLNTSDG